MKRLLVAAADRAFTRFVAESVLQRALTLDTPRTSDAWEVARAHTALEALLLLTRGGRPFDALLLDHPLPDRELLELLAEIRSTNEGRAIPIFLLSERGRDPHSRRNAVERFAVTRILDKPVTAELLRDAIANLERRQSILLAEPDGARAEAYLETIRRAGYTVERVETGRAALERAPRLLPDLVLVALHLPDLRGTEVCVELKKTLGLQVILYGQLAGLAQQEISDNALRADDFLQAPFDDDLLVERAAARIGRGPSMKQRWRLGSVTKGGRTTPLPPTVDIATENERTVEGKPPQESAEDSRTEDLDTPPPSASPSTLSPARRTTRRVPCHLSVQVRNAQQSWQFKSLDISHGGLFLATGELLPVGTELDLSFQLPDTQRELKAAGRVAWGSQPHERSPGVGVKFTRIDPLDLKLIVDYVNRVAKVVYTSS